MLMQAPFRVWTKYIFPLLRIPLNLVFSLDKWLFYLKKEEMVIICTWTVS